MHVFVYHSTLAVALWGAILAVSGFALWKGDIVVRLAALTYLAVQVATFLIHPKLGDLGGESALLAVDFASAVTFLLLAVRFANLWIGAAMILEAAQFSLHAYYLVMEMPHDRLHAWINNTTDAGILICILVGTVLSVRQRVARRNEQIELEARRRQRSSAAA